MRESARQQWARTRQQADARARTMRAWAELVPEPGYGPLNFRDFPFQVEWYSDEIADAEEVVLKKSTQVGASAYSWRWGVRQADQFGVRSLYIFPTATDVYDFGDDRIEPAIDESPYLQGRLWSGSVKNKGLKRIGNGFVYLRGSQSKSGAQSVAAGALVFDEYDHLDETNVPQIERRLSGARGRGETPRVRRLGIPTVPDYGIDALYQASDRRVWIVTCPECEHEQEITWWENVRWTMPGGDKVHRAGHDAKMIEDPKVVERAWRACAHCEAELEGDPIRTGRWVAQNPGARTIGYHVTRLIVPLLDVGEIVAASRATKEKEVEAFHNNDLGEAYSPSEASLDRGTIEAAAHDPDALEPQQVYKGRRPVTMGVDAAGERDLTVRISEQLDDGRRRAVWEGEVDSFAEVERLMRLFRVTMCAIDANPERRNAKALRSKHLGRVVLVEYDYRWRSESMKLEADANSVPVKVRVNRTEAIDAMMDAVRQMRSLPLSELPPKYVEQMIALKRRTTEDKRTGEPERVYVTTGSQGDDYAHAEVYDLVATELWRMREQIRARLKEMSGEHMPDEALGFRRVKLGAEDDTVDDYRPGFGGE